MMFNEPEDEEASEVVKRPHLTTSAMKKDLQMADGLVDLSLRLTIPWIGV